MVLAGLTEPDVSDLEGKVTVRAPGLTLEFNEATKARLYLRAEDLGDKAGVKISLGGKQFVRPAKAEVKVMLEDFAERFDRTFIVSARVDVP